ncbi:SusC/RagA family TonB-linked outer membrane protein [Salinimicrobium flavum]|uniref:SusC/RagA family TonB-linked outer membrane protein n=1 Tax=Salinimicrobium flavum TaxID=1737065 RepID=A0ABW5ITN4_9FLAO
MKNYLLVIFAFLIIHPAFAQVTKTITGQILDPQGMPLPGAEVKVIDKNIFDITDFDGNFTLEGVEVGDTFRVTFLGFEPQEFTISDQNEYILTLQQSAAELSEVVVVGYGTQRKQDLTGSISQITPDEITRQPATTATQSIQGRAAGVQITPSGAPGSSPDVFIRGLGTAFGGQNPLYVVDGILTDNIDNINPNDIVSMDILKDASSLAIYGNRGANGVIIVNTRKGKSGVMEIKIDTYYGIKSEMEKVDMADSRSFAIYSNEALGVTDRFSENQQYNTDWFEEITRTGTVNSTNLSLSAGGDNVRTFFSSGYFEEEGLLKGNDFNRLTLRSNTDFELSEKIGLSYQASASLTDETPKRFTVFNTAYKQAPIVPVRYADGPFAGAYGVSADETGSFNNVGNPVRDLDYDNQKAKNLRLQGTFTFDYEIVEWLSFTSRFGIESENYRYRNFTNNLELYLTGDPTRTRAGYSSEAPKTTLTITKRNSYKWVLDNFFTMDHSINELHNFKLTLGTTVEERGGEFLTGIRRNVPIDSDYWSLNNGDADPMEAYHLRDNTVRLRSYFARLNYDFDQKYLFTGTYRRDGSSQFQEGSKYGDFYSIGVGWVLSEEDFLKDSEFISFLKIRGSFGELGNQNVPLNVLTFTTGLNYPFGPDQSVNEGGTIDKLINPNLSWETTEEFDVGIEFGFLDDKLSGEIDYYNRLNRDAILPVEVPDAFGYSGVTLTPAGQVRNEGLEIALNWKDQVNEDFSYQIGGNITFNTNELEKVTNPFFAENTGGSIGNGQITKKVVEGEPLGSFWLLDVTGIDDEGNFIYDDVNDDGTINDDDKKFFGSYAPKNFYGLNFSADYKSWDFNIDAYGNYGNVVYNGKKAQRFGGENIEQDVFDNRWTPQNNSNTEPAPSNDVPLSSSYFLESGDFFRINNITIGYSIPLEENGYFKDARIYLTAQNPLISQDFSGFTPELPGDPLGLAGVELDAYPAVKSFIIGLNISL